ncbi:hypothetical protein [Neorhizobium galegae]|uniref:hypothetical protein n=1 Tax=Neorhizobium galegae TaxID=399 RepID=UPI00062108EA|nr:hypothetical protein [Neorhizobium galegae]CDZ54431.1 Hypothetical protein NGAL_HAMBI2427_56380 [Neorhizobium galegae bv. orientalis]
MDDFHFGAGEFSSELWIDSKRVFVKPRSVDVEFVNSGPFDWVFADANGKEVRTYRHDNKSGWTGIHFFSLGLTGDFSIGFRNAGSGLLKVKQGDVHF